MQSCELQLRVGVITFLPPVFPAKGLQGQKARFCVPLRTISDKQAENSQEQLHIHLPYER